MALTGQGKIEGAVSHYSEALHIKPDDVKAHNNLAVSLFGQGKTSEAITHFQEALRIKPDDAMTRHNLENAHRLPGLKHGRWREPN